jgi:hypothetical protein
MDKWCLVGCVRSADKRQSHGSGLQIRKEVVIFLLCACRGWLFNLRHGCVSDYLRQL